MAYTIDFTGKTALITGGASGIGYAIAEAFQEAGADVIVTAKSDNSLEKCNEKTRFGTLRKYKLDVTNDISIENIFAEIDDLHILVNNAATIHTALFQMTSIKKLKEVFETDFFSQTLFTQYILKSMIKKKSGSILYISSSSALDGNEGRSAYASAKAAMIAQAKVLSREVGIYNIRVNAIAPGLTNTDMMKKNTPEEILNEVTSRISLKRIANPEEIANVALLLSSDLSSYITGQVIRVDGGM